MEPTTQRKTGLGEFSATLLRPSVPHSEPAPITSSTLPAAEGVTTRVDAPAPKKKSRSGENSKTTGHKLHLPADVFQRLQLAAIQRGDKLSTIAAEILDRHLPRLTISRRD